MNEARNNFSSQERSKQMEVSGKDFSELRKELDNMIVQAQEDHPGLKPAEGTPENANFEKESKISDLASDTFNELNEAEVAQEVTPEEQKKLEKRKKELETLITNEENEFQNALRAYKRVEKEKRKKIIEDRIRFGKDQLKRYRREMREIEEKLVGMSGEKRSLQDQEIKDQKEVQLADDQKALQLADDQKVLQPPEDLLHIPPPKKNRFEEGPIGITAVDIEEKFEESERDIARTQLTQQLNNRKGRLWSNIKSAFRHPIETGRRVGRFLRFSNLREKFSEARKRGFSLHVLEDFHQQRYNKRAKEKLRSTGNFLATVDVATETVQEFNNKMKTDASFRSEVDKERGKAEEETRFIVKRFEKGGRFLEKGEEEAESVENEAMNREIARLIKDFAVGAISEEDLDKQRIQLFSQLKIKDARIVADNMKDIALEMREAYDDNKERIAAVDLNIDFKLGKFKSAITNRADYSTAEKLVKWFQEKRIPLSAGAIGFGVSMATSGAVRGLSSLSRILLPILGGGVAGAGYGAIRAGKEFRSDLEEHERDMGYGREFAKDAQRRGQMERLRHDMASWKQMKETLRALVESGIDSDSKLQAVNELIADAEARIEHGLEKKVLLRKFSDKSYVEQERFELRKQLEQCEQAATQYITDKYGKDTVQEKLYDDIAARLKKKQSSLQAGIEEKGKERRSEKRKEMRRAAVVGFGTGMVFGIGAQEALHTAGDLRIPGFKRFSQNDTLIRGGWKWLSGKMVPPAGSPIVGAPTFGATEAFAASGHLGGSLPEKTLDFSTKRYDGIFSKNGREFIDSTLKGDVRDLPGTADMGTIEMTPKAGGPHEIALVDKNTGEIRGFQVDESKLKGPQGEVSRYIWGTDATARGNFDISIDSATGKAMCGGQEASEYFKAVYGIKDISAKVNVDSIEFFEKGSKSPIFVGKAGDNLSVLYDDAHHKALMIGQAGDIDKGQAGFGLSRDVEKIGFSDAPQGRKWGFADDFHEQEMYTAGESTLQKEGIVVESLKDKAPRFDWHDEPEYRGFKNLFFEGKQRQGWIAVDKDGNIYVDAREMLKNLIDNITGAKRPFGSNWDTSVDTRLAHLKDQMMTDYQGGKLHERIQFNLIPTDLDDKAGRGMLLGHVDKNGLFKVPKEIQDMILSQAPGTISEVQQAASEAVRSGMIVNIITEATRTQNADFLFDHLEFYYESENPDGSVTRHVFATLTGTGEMAPQPQPVVGKTTDWVFRPPQTAPIVDGPPIIPFVGRRPLEPTIPPKEVPPSYYYPPEGMYPAEGKPGHRSKELTPLKPLQPKEKEIDGALERFAQSGATYSAGGRVKVLTDTEHLAPNRKEIAQAIEKKEKDKERASLLIEYGELGKALFGGEFDERSPVVQGINNADEVIVVLDNPIGDSILSVPVISAVARYLKFTNQENKPIIVVTEQPRLYSPFESKYGNLQVKDLSYKHRIRYRRAYTINTHKEDIPGVPSDDPRRILNFDWRSWEKNDMPLCLPEDAQKRKTLMIVQGQKEGAIHQIPDENRVYGTFPEKIARTFELLVGRKLFERDELEFPLKEESGYGNLRNELLTKYNLNNEPYILFTFGSSQRSKEYPMEKWKQVMTEVASKSPEKKLVFVMPRGDNEKDEVNGLIQSLPQDIQAKVVSVSENLKNIAVLVQESDLAVTPETGIGHISATLGKETIMLFSAGNPLLWSAPRENLKIIATDRAIEMISTGESIEHGAWTSQGAGKYITSYGEGAALIPPDVIAKEIEQSLSKKRVSVVASPGFGSTRSSGGSPTQNRVRINI